MSIGNSLSFWRKGFTFFEIMVAMVILAAGTVMVMKAMITCLDYQEYLTRRLYAMNLANDRMAFLEQSFLKTGKIPYTHDRDVSTAWLNHEKTDFQVIADFSAIGEFKHAVRCDTVIAWLERGRPVQLSRTAVITRF